MPRSTQAQERSKAVVFTHFGTLQYGDNENDLNRKLPEYEQHFTPILRNYLRCAQQTTRLGIIYAYVDSSLKEVFLKKSEPGTPGDRIRLLDANLLTRENELLGFLRTWERRIRGELRLEHDEAVIIRYIGIRDLITLLNSLVAIDNSLVDFLCGPNGKFTYDSPKFVEAVIRIARLDLPHLADDPVVRIDEDVTPFTTFFDRLLEEYDKIKISAPYYFFSGHYSYDGTHRATQEMEDPLSKHFLNDYAVRLHYFVEPGYKTGQDPGDRIKQLVRTFLADLDQLGATQFTNSDRFYSPALRQMLSTGRKKSGPHNSPQVISGAGLIMSRRAIDLLPPFMNFGELTVWVDDFLKRRLHETVRDIKAFDPECVDDATIRQERAPSKDPGTYLERLLRGCIFRRVLSDLDNKPSKYSQLIEDLIRYRVREGDVRLQQAALDELKRDMWKDASERYVEVIRCWSQEFYSGTFLYDWANRQPKDPGPLDDPKHGSNACGQVVNDAIEYVKLTLRWHIFVRAVQRLGFAANDWLFEETTRSLRRRASGAGE